MPTFVKYIGPRISDKGSPPEKLRGLPLVVKEVPSVDT